MIAQLLARRFDESETRVRADVDALIDGWRASGWLPSPDGDDPCRDRTNCTTESLPAPASGDLVVHACRAYQLNARLFSLEFCSVPGYGAGAAGCLDLWLDKLAGLESNRQPASLEHLPTLRLVSSGSGQGVGGPDGAISWFTDPAQTFGRLYQAMLRLAHGPSEWRAFAHASGVAWQGRGVMLAAASGSGKSTLAAYLAACGWQILGDDTVAIEPEHRSILPLPTAVGLKRGSVDVLEPLYPQLRAVREHPYGGKRARFLCLPAAAAAVSPPPLAAIVVPSYQRGRGAYLTPLSPPEAAAGVMGAGIGFSGPLDGARIQWFADLVSRTPCHCLHYDNLPRAETLLRSLVSAPTPA